VSAPRIVDRIASAIAVLVGALLVLWAVAQVAGALTPARLVRDGLLADDGWSRAACSAIALATGLAALGIVHARGLRRLLAVALLAGAGAGVALASAALELPLLWLGLALATTLGPLAIVTADDRRPAARHALSALLLGALASGVLGIAFVALSGLADATHVLDLGFLITRYEHAAPFALTALRASAVAVALLCAWAPFHLGLPELWGEGSTPLAGWLALAWPWIGWSVLVRLAGGLAPVFEEWSFDAAIAVQLFLVLGALLPGSAALAEDRLGRLFALMGIGTLSELLLAVHAHGVDPARVAPGLWGYALAWIVSGAATAGARARLPDDRLSTLAGLGARLPRTAFALTVAALVWCGLPGTFTLATRWQLWQQGLGASPAPLALVAIVLGAVLRALAAARLVACLWFRAPSRELVALGTRVPTVRLRYGIVFAAALLVELLLGLGVGPWAGRLLTLAPVLYGG
jgi:NADH:ubiquinone oxidoreductase subunit 2 (subunit N)